MAITYIPQQEGWAKSLRESVSPYLQMAFKSKLEQAAQERQQRRAMEALQQQFPEAVREQISPEGQAWMTEKTGGVPTERQSYLKIPKKFKQYVFSAKGLEGLPKGAKIDLSSAGIPLSYEKPKADFMEQLTSYNQAKQAGLLPEGMDITGITGSNVRLGTQKTTDTQKFRNDFSKAIDAINKGADPEEVKKRIIKEYGDKAEDVMMALSLIR